MVLLSRVPKKLFSGPVLFCNEHFRAYCVCTVLGRLQVFSKLLKQALWIWRAGGQTQSQVWTPWVVFFLEHGCLVFTWTEQGKCWV